MIQDAAGPFLIQDADDYAGGLLTPADVGRFMAVVDRDGKLSFALVNAPETTILANGMQQVRAIASRIQDAPDGPGKPATGDNGKALAWNQTNGKFELITVNASDADTLDSHDSTYFLAADGTTTGATSQAQTFTNGIVGPSWKPASNSTTALQAQDAAGTSIINVDTTNKRVGINTTAPDTEFHLVATNTAAFKLTNSLTDAQNKTGRFVVGHYLNAEESLLVFGGAITSTAAQIDFGGGSGAYNAATVIRFLTAVDNATVTGSERMRITGTGLVGIGTGAPGSQFNVTQPSAGVGTVATNGTTTLTGTNTVFQNMFRVGDTITVSGETARTISAIASNTSLTVTSAFSTTASGLSYTKTGNSCLDVRGNGNIGIGTNSAASRIHISGNSSGAAWGTAGLSMQTASATYTDVTTAASGTATNAVFTSFGTPTLAATNTSVTTTNSATVYIAAAPAAGTNQTLTNKYALWVDAGDTRLDGNVLIGSTGTPTAFVHIAAGTTAQAQIRLAVGVAPSTPNDGDFWYDGAFTGYASDSTTNAIVNTFRMRRASSGTPAAGFGIGFSARLMSDTTANRDAGRLTWAWSTATDASRATNGQLTAFYTTTERACITWGANSTVPLLSFYDVTTPIARQVLATGASRTVDDVITALQNLGLVKQS